MPKSKCVLPNCQNIAEHYFPIDENIRNLWVKAARLEEKFEFGWKLRKFSRVCSAHFLPSDYVNHGKRLYLNKTAVPSVFAWSNESKRRQQKTVTLKCKKPVRTYARSELPLGYVEVIPNLTIDDATIDHDPLHVPDDNIDIAEEILIPDNDQSPEDILPDQFVEEIPPMHLVEEVVSTTLSPAEVECQLMETGVQTDSVIINSCDFGQQTNKDTDVFSVYRLKNSDKKIHFYTGLETFEKLKYVFSTLGECSNLKYFYSESSVVVMDPFDHFFLTLILLRRHKEHDEAAILFGVSCKTIANIFITWVRFMSLQWRNLDLWLNRETVTASIPWGFYDKYPKTRVIIDATECPIRKPSLPFAQQVTFSSYKNRNTFKFLVGVAPCGLITYVSPCYGSSTSDRQIIEESSILTRFVSNDEIMVDKGLNVQDIFLPYNVKINMPTFFKKGNQISPETSNKDRKVASKRVHVERIIGMLKTYKILKEPMNQTETVLCSDIVYVCAMLVNFRSNIINKNA